MPKHFFHLNSVRRRPCQTMVDEAEYEWHVRRMFFAMQRVQNVAENETFALVFPPAAGRQVRLVVRVHTRIASKLAVS